MDINQQKIAGALSNKHYPLISVVVAVYNGSNYLSQQLESIAKQTYPNIEIIIVLFRSIILTVF